MAINLVAVGSAAGGFLKPEDYLQAWAILVRPKSAGMRTSPKFGEKLTVSGDIMVFPNEKAAETGQVIELVGVNWNQTYLAADAEPHVGKAFVARIGMTNSGKGYRWENVTDPDVVSAVVSYAEKADAAMSAAADDAPEF